MAELGKYSVSLQAVMTYACPEKTGYFGEEAEGGDASCWGQRDAKNALQVGLNYMQNHYHKLK